MNIHKSTGMCKMVLLPYYYVCTGFYNPKTEGFTNICEIQTLHGTVMY